MEVWVSLMDVNHNGIHPIMDGELGMEELVRCKNVINYQLKLEMGKRN